MKPRIAILLGSDSDLPAFQKALAFLEQQRIPFAIEVSSAHRTPERTLKLVRGWERRGVSVIVAAAGGAAHLAGVVAAHTLLPVLGVPMASALAGIDSLLSMAQMPGGIPVATFGIGESGALNAVLFAVHLLALRERRLRAVLARFRRQQQRAVVAKSRKLREKIQGK